MRHVRNPQKDGSPGSRTLNVRTQHSQTQSPKPYSSSCDSVSSNCLSQTWSSSMQLALPSRRSNGGLQLAPLEWTVVLCWPKACVSPSSFTKRISSLDTKRDVHHSYKAYGVRMRTAAATFLEPMEMKSSGTPHSSGSFHLKPECSALVMIVWQHFLV